MRAVVQRVNWARVNVGDRNVGEIGAGAMVLLAVKKGDEDAAAAALAKKIVELRIFADEEGKMNRSLLDTGGRMLAVSQFTLFADCSRGRRPFFGEAEMPERANKLFEQFVEAVRHRGIHVETGEFGAMMQVEMCNDGPVTICLDLEGRT